MLCVILKIFIYAENDHIFRIGNSTDQEINGRTLNSFFDTGIAKLCCNFKMIAF